MLRAPLDVLLEHRTADEAGVPDLHRTPRVGAQGPVGVVTDRGLVRLRDPEEHADDPHRHLRAEIPDEVEPVGADERIEARDAVGTDLVLEGVHPARGEDARHQPAVRGVDGRILPEDHAARDVHVGLDDLEDVATGGRHRPPVDQGLLDVGVP